MAIFSKLLPVAASAYGLQALFAAIFVPLQTDVCFDMGGALGWLATTFVSLYYPTLKARLWEGQDVPFPPFSSFPKRVLLLNLAVAIWSIRLGTFLGARAIKSGGDSRFVKIVKNPSYFTRLWFTQATWIVATGLPVWLVNALPRLHHAPLGTRDYIGLGLWASSLLLEVTADRQKAAWHHAKQLKLHDEKFISSGLWSISRHPNYLGELGVWSGVALLASKSLQSAQFPAGTVALSAISPLFTWLLVTRLSGIPPLERLGDMRFGSDPRWANYKRNVPVFWPWGSK
ncbi:DUF1295-domain-containing protein [Coprinopsis marcescibilis]|uniref:DUF1295-domain-containing protein n=1 Tax=Coprinopsis marcescibilis TaxID=230819 RepID=A0A5C3L612_COPMA|nr:DUF1295-domain-containing protein [Coprinopsis marcescibilis]